MTAEPVRNYLASDTPPPGYDECYDAIPEGYEENARIAILAALSMGWSMVVAPGPSGSLKLTSHDGKVSHNFSIGRKFREERLRRSIFDHADPARIQLLDITRDMPWEVIESLLFRQGVGRITHLPPEPEPVARPRDLPRHVVKVEPMLAAVTGGAYESKIALERTWSDDTVDYKCVKCDFETENRLGPRAHWRKHINSGEARPGLGKEGQKDAVRGIEVPLAASYMPRPYRLEALTEVINALMGEGILDPTELAKAALTWVHEQSNSGGPGAAESEPLDDSQILQRIRTLLDRGESQRMAAEIETLRNEKALLTERVETLQVEVAQARETLQAELTAVQNERDRWQDRYLAARGDLRTLRELMAGLGDDDDKEADRGQ